MKFGEVFSYKNASDAKRLIGRRVVCKDNLAAINDTDACQKAYEFFLGLGQHTLFEINEGSWYPFRVETGVRRYNDFQFIREIIDDEPHYEPYDFSNPEIRESLLGKRFLAKYAGIENKYEEYQVTGFIPPNRFSGEWLIGGIRAKDFMRSFVWSDYSVCGEKAKEKQ